jgi:hypothetical protein
MVIKGEIYEISARLELLCNLSDAFAQETGVSKSLVQTATKLLKIKLFRIMVVHKFKF